MRTRSTLLPYLLSLIAAAGCSSESPRSPSTPVAMPSLSEVTDSQWAALSGTKVFFGHQSVGFNILEGIRTVLAANPKIGLKIVESEHPETVEGGALVHAFIGVNGLPATKLAAFDAVMMKGIGPQGGIAMYKYCFLDITAATDVESVFQTYRNNMVKLHQAHPDIRFVHITTPLTVNGSGWRNLIKRLLGKPTAADFNAKRNQYNRMLRAEYQSSEPLFDLAAFESTHADGSREFFTRGQDTVYTLAPELTDDGAHLNANGREAAAIRFLQLLASTASPSR